MSGVVNVENLSILLVFADGVVSFFSPCVVPLLPLYVGYLSGNAKLKLDDGSVVYERKKVLIQTFAFVLGISFSFLLMGLTFTALGHVINNVQSYFQILAGVLILVLALFQLGVLKSGFLTKQRRLPIEINPDHMSPTIAFVMGFLFSFTWTPCVGPALTSVLLLVSTSALGYVYVLVYALGFVIPFLLLGLFTTQVLNYLNSRKKWLDRVVKVGAAILLLMGGYSLVEGIKAVNPKSSSITHHEKQYDTTKPNFIAEDVDGMEHALQDYQGHAILVNFFTTWCPYCQDELEEFRKLSDEYEDLSVIGILVVDRSEDKESAKAYLRKKDLNYTVLIDDGTIAALYGVNGYPMTFVYSTELESLGYIPGAVGYDYLKYAYEVSKNPSLLEDAQK